MLRLTVLSFVAAALSLTAPAFSPPPDRSEVEAQLLKAANDFRADNGLGRLSPNARLSGEARSFAEYLARTGGFSHTADGREPSDRALAAGYEYCTLAENLAYESDSSGFSIERLVRLLMAGWEASPGHRRNLLDRDVTETGVGVARAPGENQKYVAVQVFGRPVSDRYSFSIENETSEAAGYVFEGEHRWLPAHTRAVHTTCAAGDDVAFDRDIAPVSRRFAVGPGMSFLLSPAHKGVQIEVHRPAQAKGRVDVD